MQALNAQHRVFKAKFSVLDSLPEDLFCNGSFTLLFVSHHSNRVSWQISPKGYAVRNAETNEKCLKDRRLNLPWLCGWTQSLVVSSKQKTLTRDYRGPRVCGGLSWRSEGSNWIQSVLWSAVSCSVHIKEGKRLWNHSSYHPRGNLSVTIFSCFCSDLQYCNWMLGVALPDAKLCLVVKLMVLCVFCSFWFACIFALKLYSTQDPQGFILYQKASERTASYLVGQLNICIVSLCSWVIFCTEAIKRTDCTQEEAQRWGEIRWKICVMHLANEHVLTVGGGWSTGSLFLLPCCCGFQSL